jgi:hypothetical protein
MPGINPSHRTTSIFGLVLDERFDLSERPAMQAPGLLPVAHRGSADVLQILQNDCATRRARFHDLLGEDVIAVAPEPPLFSSNSSEVTLGRLRPLGLEGASKIEGARLHCSPSLLTEEKVVGCDGRLREPEIHADNIRAGGYIGSWQVHNHVQEPSPVPVDEVSGESLSAGILDSAGRHNERDSLTTGSGRQYDYPGIPENLECMDVVARRASISSDGAGHVPSLVKAHHRGPNRLGGSNPGLDVQVAHESGELGLQGSVGGMVKSNPVALAVLPSVGADRIEGCGELERSFTKNLGLILGRIEYNPSGTIHTSTVPYTVSFCNRKREAS